jgi:hypothetical protein
MDIENPGTEVQVQAPAVMPVKPKLVRKPKVAAPLVLPVPVQIDGKQNATLGAAIEKRFKRIAFYTDSKPGAKPFAIIHDTENPKSVKSPGTAMEHFIHAIADAALSGAGMSGDGSALYVDDNIKRVMASAPKFGTYTLEFTPAGRAGVRAYRASVTGWLSLVQLRAAIVRTSKKLSGTKDRTVREPGTKESAKVEVQF